MNDPESIDGPIQRFFLSSWRPYALLAIAVLALYGHTVFFTNLTYQDDDKLIVESYPLISNPGHLKKVFVEDVYHHYQGGNLYRPLLTLSFMVDARLSIASLTAYRCTNLLLHAIAVVLVFLFFRQIGIQRKIAFLTSLLFACHPALAQAVAWIPGRNDSLLAVFVLGSMMTLLRYHATARVRWALLHAFFFALAMFTKETAIVLPLLAVFMLTVVAREKPRLLTIVLLMALWASVLAVWSALRSAAFIVSPAYSFSTVLQLLQNSWLMVVYLGSAVWPFATFVISVVENMNVLPGIAAILVVAACCFLADRRDWRLLSFGAIWFLGFLVLTTYYHPDVHVQPRYTQHRIYVSLIGLLLLFPALSFSTEKKALRTFGKWLFGATIALFGVLTVRQTFVFEDAMSFNETVAETSPDNRFAHYDVRMMMLSDYNGLPAADEPWKAPAPSRYRMQLAELSERLRAQIALKPRDAGLHHLLAITYFGQGLLRRSEWEFKESLSLVPGEAIVQFNTGVLYYHGHFERKSEEHWLRTVELDPSMADAHFNLCYLYYRWKQYPEALAYADRAERIGANLPPELLRELKRLVGDSLNHDGNRR